jgi:2-keto-4-pentenoate hydratase/2-oxohepta-3-ene-1,7-dioic acid hydratase in catechol pathway
MLFTRQVPMVEIFGRKIPQPEIFIDFLAFEKHVKQYRERRGATVPRAWYDHATYYIIPLPPEKVFGPGEEVSIPALTKMADYEFELGCLVTKEALLTSFEEAFSFVKNHCLITVINDWSCRDIQKVDMEGLGPTNSKLIVGKSIGPKFVPASELAMDENGVFDLPMRLTVNGETRCDTNFNTLYHVHPETGKRQAWSFAKLLLFLGQFNISVHPGYLIGSGTVGDGSIGELSAKFDPTTGEILEPARYPWLKDGDMVEFEVTGIGKLHNRVAIKTKIEAEGGRH